MKRIALKIDVDTYQGTRTGVPALAEMLQRHGVQATFFFSLGPDHSGCESRTESLKSYYGLTSRLYGRLFPGPDIGARCRDTLRAIRDLGFEAGIHAWNRARWERHIFAAGNDLAETEIDSVCRRFDEIFGATDRAHAAAGWRTNRHALRLMQRKGFSYASDFRGSHPFLPVIEGELIACAQIPTTLPTADELFALEPDLSPDQAMDRILQLSKAIPGDHVYTLRAELEGMKFPESFDRLLGNWTSNGFSVVALRDIHASLDVEKLPKHTIEHADIPGRVGPRMVQGGVFLQS